SSFVRSVRVSLIVVAFRRLSSLLVSTMPADRDKDVDTSSDFSITSAKTLGHSPNAEGAMTDAHFAADLIQETYPIRAGRNVKAAIGDAFEALKRRERNLPQTVLRERSRQWTERRVRALWNREARRVDHYEIQDLTAIAVEEARRERQHLKAREERLVAILAAADQGGMGQVARAKGRGVRAVDLSGIGLTDADETADQSQGWGI
ncbi:MAG: hypothetical protein ACOH2M_31910, partial [Cypionkella sp.]